MRLIGITGFIGSGKTTVGQILRDLGFVVFDMDVWCRKMYFEKSFLDIIHENFPQTFINGKFDKKVLRNLVFSNEKELQKLEGLTHPYLKQKLLHIIHKNRLKPYLCFIESALLYKMNLDKYCSDVIITTAPYKVMQNRVMLRDHISAQDFDKIFKNQYNNLNIDEFCFVINTHQNLSTLTTDILQILSEIEEC